MEYIDGATLRLAHAEMLSRFDAEWREVERLLDLAIGGDELRLEAAKARLATFAENIKRNAIGLLAKNVPELALELEQGQKKKEPEREGYSW